MATERRRTPRRWRRAAKGLLEFLGIISGYFGAEMTSNYWLAPPPVALSLRYGVLAIILDVLALVFGGGGLIWIVRDWIEDRRQDRAPLPPTLQEQIDRITPQQKIELILDGIPLPLSDAENPDVQRRLTAAAVLRKHCDDFIFDDTTRKMAQILEHSKEAISVRTGLFRFLYLGPISRDAIVHIIRLFGIGNRRDLVSVCRNIKGLADCYRAAKYQSTMHRDTTFLMYIDLLLQEAVELHLRLSSDLIEKVGENNSPLTDEETAIVRDMVRYISDIPAYASLSYEQYLTHSETIRAAHVRRVASTVAL